MLDVLPHRANAAHVRLRFAHRSFAGPRPGTEGALKKRKLCLVIAQEFYVFERACRANGG